MSRDSLIPGAVFGGDFRIVKALRAGGMGAVYVVDQLSTGKQRALKVMAPELAADPAIQERFVLEARAASKIDSDHVVEIVTAGVDEGSHSPFLVMELLRGQELADVMVEKGPIALGDVAEVLSQVGHALEMAHAHGIVHRDLKPENIFLATSRRREVPFTAKVLDFGIAKLVEDSRQKTGTQPLGTPLFMAPEQTDRKGRICPGTDVWALGLITFRLLTGVDFWREVDGSLPQLLREIVVDELPLASLRANELGVAQYLPPGFDAWFHRCVNRDIDARFAEAGAAVRAFRELAPHAAPTGSLVMQVGTMPHTGSNPMPTGPGFTPPPVRITPPRAATGEGYERTSVVVPSSPLAGSTTGNTALAGTTALPKRSSRAWLALPVVAVAAAAGWFMFGRGSSDTPGPNAANSGNVVAGATPTASASASASAAAIAAEGSCPAGMVFIKGGNMVMGAKDASEDAAVTHKVTLKGFCLDRTEVTVAAYDKCSEMGDCEKAPQTVSYPNMKADAPGRFAPLCNARKAGMEKHPINCVDWLMANRYCESHKARLPSEAEWEYAARGSSQRTYPWGDDAPSQVKLNACGTECQAWGKEHAMEMQTAFQGDDGFPATAPVGSFPEGKSSAGVLDLAGNVWEWTADWYAPYQADAATDPRGPDKGTERVIRGGAFNGSMADWSKPAYRYKQDPKAYNHAIGFRCAADAK
ncbi:MAG: bifunctional serine/threonine-protein kinase/formylglycine-generating enzyme family protein [Polyangiaceae bacterium]